MSGCIFVLYVLLSRLRQQKSYACTFKINVTFFDFQLYYSRKGFFTAASSEEFLMRIKTEVIMERYKDNLYIPW